ncbi:MAG: orotate phosphoribosyltransferase [Gammaproteobacteria bacterium]|nr:MAG: orotate phosphoribosyltransferase [Gammaproteobacteria bacterium]
MAEIENRFLELAIDLKALLFGDFILKSGKKSLFFFNISVFLETGNLAELAEMYSEKITELNLDYDVIFGPAYKGIPLASAVATTLNQKSSKKIPICFDRKEEKNHGEGGSLVGSVKDKKVLIIDDVLTMGTALKNSIRLVKESGGTISGAIIALDRQEQDQGGEVSKTLMDEFGFPIFSISNLSNLIIFLKTSGHEGIAEKLRVPLNE